MKHGGDPAPRSGAADPWDGLAALDGRGIRVAVVDSGITARHPHVGPILEGAAFLPGPQGGIVRGTDTEDRIGHGTACAAVIREILPRAGILPVRIFGDRLEADSSQVAAAIDWAVGRGARIVNLSLAVQARSGQSAPLLEACRRALDQGVAIVAARAPAGPGPGRPPGLVLEEIPELLLVGPDRTCPPELFRADPDHPEGFLACPFAREAPGLPRERNLQGPSIATARISGACGKLLQAFGPLDPAGLRTALQAWIHRLDKVGS